MVDENLQVQNRWWDGGQIPRKICQKMVWMVSPHTILVDDESNIMLGWRNENLLVNYSRKDEKKVETLSEDCLRYRSPLLMTPEICVDHNEMRKALVYTIGVVMWCLLAGRVYQDGVKGKKVAELALKQRRRPNPKTIAEVDEELPDIIATMLCHKHIKAPKAFELKLYLSRFSSTSPFFDEDRFFQQKEIPSGLDLEDLEIF